MKERELRPGVTLMEWDSQGGVAYSLSTGEWWMNFRDGDPITLPMPTLNKSVIGHPADGWPDVGHAFMEMGRRDPLWPLLSLLYDWP